MHNKRRGRPEGDEERRARAGRRLDGDRAAHRDVSCFTIARPRPLPTGALAAVLVVEEEAVEGVRQVVRRGARARCPTTASRRAARVDGHGPAAAASRAARSRPGSRRPGAAGRGRPRPTTRRLPPQRATPNSRADASCRATASRATSARSTGSRETENSCRFIRARSSRSRTSRSSRRASTQDRPRRLLRRERALGEALGVAADRGQRRLQLVADREQEVPLALA